MKLSEVSVVLREIGVSPVRSLGQNFLHDRNMARWIVDQAKLTVDDYVVEIGPGLGALTQFALAKGARVLGLAPADAQQLLKHRFAGINIWRAIRGPVKQLPLALCDAQSVQTGDLVASDLILRGRVSETYKVAYNASHRWYYFPDMRPDEAIVIKCYDSDESRARFTPHAAFNDPTTAPDSPPRESIEVRAFAFFGPECA